MPPGTLLGKDRFFALEPALPRFPNQSALILRHPAAAGPCACALLNPQARTLGNRAIGFVFAFRNPGKKGLLP
jgi:hypothetical protein